MDEQRARQREAHIEGSMNWISENVDPVVRPLVKSALDDLPKDFERWLWKTLHAKYANKKDVALAEPAEELDSVYIGQQFRTLTKRKYVDAGEHNEAQQPVKQSDNANSDSQRPRSLRSTSRRTQISSPRKG